MIADATMKVFRFPVLALRLTIVSVERLDREEEDLWDRSFATSHDVLRKLGQHALDEYIAGRTEPLDPDAL